MFEQSMIPKVRRKPWTLAVAVLGQVAVVTLVNSLFGKQK